MLARSSLEPTTVREDQVISPLFPSMVSHCTTTVLQTRWMGSADEKGEIQEVWGRLEGKIGRQRLNDSPSVLPVHTDGDTAVVS
jgi:hypothetical protein